MKKLSLPKYAIENGGFYKRARSTKEIFYKSREDNAIAKSYNTFFLNRKTWRDGFEDIFMAALLDANEFKNLLLLFHELPAKNDAQISHKLNLSMALALLKSPLSTNALHDFFWKVINKYEQVSKAKPSAKENKIWAACGLIITGNEKGEAYLKGMEQSLDEEEICWIASLLDLSWKKMPRDYLEGLKKRHAFLLG
jgi:hypothetical protein